MGTPEAQIFIDPADYADKPEVFDDFDLEVTHNSEEWRRAIENSENLAAFTAKTGITLRTYHVVFLAQCSQLVCLCIGRCASIVMISGQYDIVL
jgi:hypothetical protein